MNLRGFGIWLVGCWMSVCVTVAFAHSVPAEAVATAAETLLAEALFRETFPQATVASVEAVGELWCVNLSPQGHLLFSGSTKVEPLLAYSKADYVMPPKGHPALTVQEKLQARVRHAEWVDAVTLFSVGAAEQTAAERTWERLLNPPSVSLFATTYTKQVGPLISTTWNQWRPWNDLVPQATAESDATNDAYQGRMPIGCVATMYSQVMKHFQWPARLDRVFSQTLEVTDGALGKSYEMRMHGGLPIDWSALKNVYKWNGETELERLPIARLGLLTDILSNMEFAPEGSGAVLDAPCNNDWYDYGECDGKEAEDSFENLQIEAIKRSLENGSPVLTSIPGHAIITDGYAEEASGKTYLHVNYGWGGQEDAFYSANEASIIFWVLNHRPYQLVQVEPVPAKVANGHLLKWHYPAYWESTLSGFTVTATPYDAQSLTAWTEPANSIDDPQTDTTVYSIATASDKKIPVFKVASGASSDGAACTLSGYFVPTERSTLTFVSTAYYTLGYTLELQIWSEQHQQWTTIQTIPTADRTTGAWQDCSVSLKAYANQFCKLRLYHQYQWGSGYYRDGYYQVGNLNVSNTYGKPTHTTTQTWNVESETRQYTLSGLSEGCRYVIGVRPVVTSGSPRDGMVFTTATTETITAPAITAVKTIIGANLSTNPLLNGDLNGTSGLRVTCNDAVVEVRVQSSCPTLIPDSAIKVYRYAPNVFDVIITSPQTKTALDGSRMLLTIEAVNAQGDKAYREVVFALRSGTASISYTVPELSWTLDSGKTVIIPHYWFRGYGLATTTTTASTFQALAGQDTDNDGLFAWQEYLCGTSPVDATDKLKITGLEFNPNGILKQVHYTPQEAPLVEFILEGKQSLNDAAWSPYNPSTQKFFRVRAEVK